MSLPIAHCYSSGASEYQQPLVSAGANVKACLASRCSVCPGLEIYISKLARPQLGPQIICIGIAEHVCSIFSSCNKPQVTVRDVMNTDKCFSTDEHFRQGSAAEQPCLSIGVFGNVRCPAWVTPCLIDTAHSLDESFAT